MATNISNQQVRYFLALCKTGSFTGAAKVCGVRQPTISDVIRRLEVELGGALIARSNPVQLTALGAALQPHFVLIEEAIERASSCAALHAQMLKSKPPAEIADTRCASLP